MISQVKSFPYPDKQRAPEEGQRIQRPKRYVTYNNNKDEDNSPKNNTQNIAHQASSQKFRQIGTCSLKSHTPSLTKILIS